MIDFNPSEITFENIDRYHIKKSLFHFVEEKINLYKGNLVDVGCGEMPYRKCIMEKSSIESYTGVDLIGGTEYHKDIKPDFYWDGIQFPFLNESYDSAIATEVLEHCHDPKRTLIEVYRILKTNSPLLLTVPVIWPTHESPYDFYRYTPFGLEYLLKQAGFQDIEITCLGGWDASLAQVISLWIKRRKMSSRKQRVLFNFLKPIIKFLLKKDRILDPMTDQNLITSLGAVAWKK